MVARTPSIQYREGSRLKAGRCGPELVAASVTIPGIDQQGAFPETPSSSSFRPAGKHSAIVEFCCGPGSIIGKEALRQSLKVLRVTTQSYDLTTESGRAAVSEDVRKLVSNHKTHLWASLPCRPWPQLAELNGRKLGREFRIYVEMLRDESLVLLRGVH